MSYRLILTRDARHAIRALRGSGMVAAIQAAIDALTTTPRPPGCRSLVGRSGWRIRVGDYRVMYDIDDPGQRVTVFGVAHRRDAYRDR